MVLADTNIFLEILLKQEKSELCKSFLNAHIRETCISDFSLHSLGVILFRHHHEQLFEKFISDIFPQIKLTSLPNHAYERLVEWKDKVNLDFDDLYQYSMCRYFDLRLLTMDQDFKHITEIDVEFL